MNQNKKKIKFTFGQMFMAVIVLLLAIGLVLNYLSLHNLTAKINEANNTYTKLSAENAALDQEILKQVNFSNIDQLAAEIGMVKVEPYQIQYVNIEGNDIMTSSKAEADQGGLVDNIVRSFSIVVEYLR